MTAPAPAPAPVAPEELVSLARGVIRENRFPFLATMDGDEPRLRPVTLSWEEGFQIYFVSLRRFHKTVELASNPKAEFCFMNEKHDQVRISGVAEVVTDQALRKSAWDQDPLLPRYLGSLDNPEFMLWRVRPTRVRYMKEWSIDYHEVPLPPGA
jgi:general stress protein 26